MPTVIVYLDDQTYWKCARLANTENLTIGKTIQLIVKSYFLALERGEICKKEKGNTELSTKAT